MSRFWEKLLCAHCWLSVGIVDMVPLRGYLTRYECHKCGKTIDRYDMPISYINDHPDHGDLL